MKNKKQNTQSGAITVEYALAMVIAVGFVVYGTTFLFDSSNEVLTGFVQWLQPHYP